MLWEGRVGEVAAAAVFPFILSLVLPRIHATHNRIVRSTDLAVGIVECEF